MVIDRRKKPIVPQIRNHKVAHRTCIIEKTKVSRPCFFSCFQGPLSRHVGAIKRGGVQPVQKLEFAVTAQRRRIRSRREQHRGLDTPPIHCLEHCFLCLFFLLKRQFFNCSQSKNSMGGCGPVFTPAVRTGGRIQSLKAGRTMGTIFFPLLTFLQFEAYKAQTVWQTTSIAPR